jgi:hypothetical protein
MIMNSLLKVFSTIVLSIVLFVGILSTGSISAYGLAVVTPKEAADIIRESDSVQEAGDKLKAADSSEKVRDRETLDTAKEIRDSLREAPKDRNIQQDHERAKRDDRLETTKEKLKDAAENVKEKLNLDEPLAPSTKEFLGKRQEEIEQNGDVVVREEPGYYQRDRQPKQFVEQDNAQNYHQEMR